MNSRTEPPKLVAANSVNLDNIVRDFFGKTSCCCQCKGSNLLSYTYLSLTYQALDLFQSHSFCLRYSKIGYLAN